MTIDQIVLITSHFESVVRSCGVMWDHCDPRFVICLVCNRGLWVRTSAQLIHQGSKMVSFAMRWPPVVLLGLHSWRKGFTFHLISGQIPVLIEDVVLLIA